MGILAHYNTRYMKSLPAIMPRNLAILKILGENIQLARLRRRFSAQQLSERAGISRKTLYNIGQGSPTVSMGNYLQVLFVLGLVSC
jgi:predicted transcriptional regulator